MLAVTENKPLSSLSTSVVSDAVGLPLSHWFVAIVKQNTEKAVRDRLEESGHECYVAVQEEMHVWKNGRKSKVERVLIPSIVFIRSTEEERKKIVNLPYITRFMVDPASGLQGDHRPLAKVPADQIEKLRFMVGHSSSPVTIGTKNYKKGDKVRVIRGSLKGMEGEVNSSDGKSSELVVNIDFIGSARLKIDTINVEPIKD